MTGVVAHLCILDLERLAIVEGAFQFNAGDADDRTLTANPVGMRGTQDQQGEVDCVRGIVISTVLRTAS